MDKENKRRLNDRIVHSAKKYRRKQRLLKASYVTGFAVLIALGAYSWLHLEDDKMLESKIVDHATSQEVDFNTDSDVRLILGNKKEVTITQVQPKIKYSQNGSTVSISNFSELKQVASSNEPVFNTIIVPYGKRSEISLSDGTRVWLNSGTKFTYPVAFNGPNREVHLEGEAIFDVVHLDDDLPFNVLTENYTVKVLGTIFNVSSYPEDDFSNTALASGSVELSYSGTGNTKTIKITPGTLATFDKGRKQMNTLETDIGRYMSWREGRFTFRNNDLNYILTKIARHYGVKVNSDKDFLKDETFSGTVDIKGDLKTVLDVISTTSGLEIETTDNQIIIKQPR